MLHLVAGRLTEWCAGLLEFEDGERETVLFGLEVFLDGVIKAAVLAAAGVLLHRLPEFIMTMLIFCSLRYWAGGAHCGTSFRCLWAMLAMCAGSAFGSIYLSRTPLLLMVLLMAVLFGIVFRYAPWQSKLNPNGDMRLHAARKRGAVLWLFLECAVILTVGDVRWKWVLFIPAMIEVLSILPVWGSKTANKERSAWKRKTL